MFPDDGRLMWYNVTSMYPERVKSQKCGFWSLRVEHCLVPSVSSVSCVTYDQHCLVPSVSSVSCVKNDQITLGQESLEMMLEPATSLVGACLEGRSISLSIFCWNFFPSHPI